MAKFNTLIKKTFLIKITSRIIIIQQKIIRILYLKSIITYQIKIKELIKIIKKETKETIKTVIEIKIKIKG